MPLGITASGRTVRTTRPLLQVPGVPPVIDPPPDPGGGGTAPTAPSDVTAGVPASMLIGYGTGHVNQQLANYTTWKGWGFGGYTTKMGNHYLVGFGNNQLFKTAGGAIGAGGHVISAVGDTSGPYDYQQAYEGYGVPGINGAAYGTFLNIGGFRAKAQGLTTKMYLAVKLVAQSATSTGAPFGDWFDDTLWASVCSAVGNIAAGALFLGGDGIKFDMENNVNSWDDAATAGHTNAQQLVKIEQRGYEFSKAVYQAFPNCECLLYDWPMPHSWYDEVLVRNNAVKTPPVVIPLKDAATDNKTQFIYGMLRAMTEFGGPQSKWWQIDSFWYRGSTQYGNNPTPTVATALKWNTYAGLSHMTQKLPAATRNGAFKRFYMTPFSWAGIDANNAIGQQGSPAWENSQDINRLYGMGGLRAEYNFNGTPGAQSTAPDATKTPPVTGSIWYPGNDYSTPANRTTRLFAAASTTSQDNHVPTLSASASGTGSTRTISGTAAHAYGIHYIEAYVYPSGTPVVATMTFNAGGGSQTTNIDNAFMSYTLNLTGVTAGQYAIVTAVSTIGQRHSVVVSLGGTAAFRLFGDTSLWNTVKTNPTFDADADAVLSSATYDLNNGAFCHPFFIGTASDPTWTVTSTIDGGWGKPARTVTFKAPNSLIFTSGSDHVCTVLDQTTGLLWDMYAAGQSYPMWNATTHVITTDYLVEQDGVNGSGFGNQQTFASVGTSAIGIAQASGTILASDVNAGSIPHALFMAFDYSIQGGVNTSGTPSVAPAVANDVGGGPGPLPEGGLMLASGSEPGGLNAMEHQLWLACSTYGVYDCDRLDGNPMFVGDGSATVTNAFTGAGLTAIGRTLRLVRTSW